LRRKRRIEYLDHMGYSSLAVSAARTPEQIRMALDALRAVV
jgi:hypothetical protein